MPVPPVYLDNHATTRVDPIVLAAMMPYFDEWYGNSSSLGHRQGVKAAEAVEWARGQVAGLLNTEPDEITFTSGATESNNLAIQGILAARRIGTDRPHVVTSSVEHRSVLDLVKRLGRQGADVTIVKPDAYGWIGAESIAEALCDRTVLVSIMAANNEVGTINPIALIGRLCRDLGVAFHTDATQAVGKVRVDLTASEVDLLSLSAHKFHGPKGIGALYTRRRGPRRPLLEPLCEGGGQERGLRPGTVAVPLVVGLGKAIELCSRQGEEDASRIRKLRDRLELELRQRVAEVRVNGHPTERLAGNLSASFPGVDGEALLMGLRRISVSSGSACSTAEPDPSHVLTAIGVDADLARATLRFGIGRFNTEEDIDIAIDEVARLVGRLRSRG